MEAIVRYSEAFKQQVLREIEEGRFGSVQLAARTYGIRGGATIQNWMRRYGREHMLRKVVHVETPKEVSEVKELRKRVRDLEKALADAHLDHMLDDAYLHIACRAAGIEDVDGFKKKHAGKP
jgi:transposase-like protein